MHYDVIVRGGGAAGLMCALTAGRRGRRVALLESNESVGAKIAISGGGRCNFTNINATPDNYLSANPDFCKSALARFTPWDFVAMVEQHGIAYHEKKLGQQFCDGSARAIIEMLLAECAAAQVDVRCGVRVQELRKPGHFVLASNAGELECDALVVATGGLSFAKLGASDFGYRVARQFGLRLVETRPGLVPLTLAPRDLKDFGPLSGLAVPVVARHRSAAFGEAMLFTHRGLSGPAILQISSFWRDGETLHFDLLPEKEFTIGDRATQLPAVLAHDWPRRFADAWCARHAPAKPLGQIAQRDLAELARLLHDWPLIPAGTEGYAKAEVTLGGVDTTELSSKTMETRQIPGLYFIGEVVDVTGWLGGYNFQWAWASGHAAGGAVQRPGRPRLDPIPKIVPCRPCRGGCAFGRVPVADATGYSPWSLRLQRRPSFQMGCPYMPLRKMSVLPGLRSRQSQMPPRMPSSLETRVTSGGSLNFTSRALPPPMKR